MLLTIPQSAGRPAILRVTHPKMSMVLKLGNLASSTGLVMVFSGIHMSSPLQPRRALP